MRNSRKAWKYFLIFFSGIGFICTIQLCIAYLIFQPENFDLAKFALYVFPVWWAWIFLTPLILKLIQWFPISKDQWLKGISFHLVSGFAMMLVHMVLFVLWEMYSNGQWITWFTFTDRYAKELLTSGWPQIDILIYWGILAVVYVLNYVNEIRRKEIKNLQLKSNLNQARLNTLKMQIHPHFMFNTLNVISTLILKGHTDESQKMLSKFSHLLRLSIDYKERSETTVADEIDFIKNYLDIEQIRFKHRLQVNFNVDESAEQLKIPPLILQPLIENSLKHAVSESEESAAIEVTAKHHEHTLELSVSDNGPGMRLPFEESETDGIGLSNTISRLKTIYDDAVDVDLHNKSEGGLEVLIKIKQNGLNGYVAN